uniref:UDP-galactose transporter n=2 Tax=Meloidogyne TaxID=189290 RepID=A0A914N1Z3_MELIC
MPAFTSSINDQDLNININSTSCEELKNLNNGQTYFEDNEEEKCKEEKEEKEEENIKKGITREIPKKFHLIKYASLFVLVVQNTSQVLLMRYATTRNPSINPPFLKTVAVFFNEIVKFFTSLILFFLLTGNNKKAFCLIKKHFFTNFLDTLKVGIPAFIYVIQNFLLYVAVENLDAGTYMVTYQLKILTTAIFTVLILKRKLSIQQWISLIVLIFGVAIVQISANKNKQQLINNNNLNTTTIINLNNLTNFVLNNTNKEILTNISSPSSPSSSSLPHHQHIQNPFIGFISIIIACILSGFAGIYLEKILKSNDVSIWLRNTQLAFLSIPIGLFVIWVNDSEKVRIKGFMQGFDLIVWMAVLLQALGGLVVAIVIKYADNILKAFGTSVSIVVATIASILLFSNFPSLLFIGGAVLVIGAVVLYGIFPYKKRKYLEEEEEELKQNSQKMEIIK